MCCKVTQKISDHLTSHREGEECRRALAVEGVSVKEEVKRSTAAARAFTMHQVVSEESLAQMAQGSQESMRALRRLCADMGVRIKVVSL